MNKVLISLFLLVASCSVYAADWYVCPDTQGEYGLEDGTSLANCFDGDADIGWASINAGDTLYMCGDWLPADARITVEDSGSAGSYITLSGDATACSRTKNSTISREGEIGVPGRAIAASNTAATRQYIKITKLTISSCSDYCILWDFSTTGAITDDTALWVDNVTITNGGTTAALRHTGENLIVTNSKFDYCLNDCIFARGKDVTVTDTTFDHISHTGTTGDGIQIDGTSDGSTPLADTGEYVVQRNTIDHSDADVKYGILIGPTAGTGNLVTVTDNVVYGYLEGGNVSTSNEGILVDAGSAATVARLERNYVYGGRFGLSLTGASAITFTTRAKIVGNVVHGQNFRGIFNNANVDDIDVWNNTIYGADDAGYYNGFSGTPDVNFNNNIVAYSGTGAYFITAPSTRTYNNYFANTTNVSSSGTGQSLATGDIVTDPALIGGNSPRVLADFYPRWNSGVRRAGRSLGAGAIQDCGNRRMFDPPSIGACEAKTRGTVTNDR